MELTESDPPANRVSCASSPDSSETSLNQRVEADTYRAGTPTSFQGESEAILMVHGDTVAVSESLHGEDMELDRAVVPAHKAPRAP